MADTRSAYTDGIAFYGRHTPRELAEKFGTPLYVYNENILRQRCRELTALSDLPGFCVNYSVKANSNPALLRIIREEGLVVDAMSPGELYMDTLAGYPPDEILYISNNNDADELLNAIRHGCLTSVDSLSQLESFGRLNPGGKVMVRLNPGIGAGHSDKVITAGKATKFGITPDRLGEIVDIMNQYGLVLAGVNQHIGSLFMEPEDYLQAAAVLLEQVEGMPGAIFSTLEVIDFGGGFGIPYHKYDNEKRLDMTSLGTRLHDLLAGWQRKTGYGGRFLVEPGRYVVAECGILLGRVTAVKNNGSTRYVGTDIGFNVLMRPVLYDSFHDVEIYRGKDGDTGEPLEQTIVGNICESGDILARSRHLPPIIADDVLGILDAGAYGFSMASNYNQRLLPAEILVDAQGTARLIRRRQTLGDLAACLVRDKGAGF